MSSIINKVKDAVTPGHSTHPTQGTAEGVHGPHDSRVANAADPRVDSDRDHRAAVGRHTAGDDYTTSGNYGLSGSGPAPNTQGPHKSDMANRVDPRVDSDADNSRTIGNQGVTGTNLPEGTRGPHNSRMANMADPRVDSDNDRTIGLGAHPHTATSGTTGNTFGTGNTLGNTTGTTGTGTNFSAIHGTSDHGTSEGQHGPHGSRLANAADPRVDSDRDHRAAHSTTGTGGTRFSGTTGTAEGVHGPHDSRLANAADPRVDSDLDGRERHHMGTSGMGTHGIGSTSKATSGMGTHGKGTSLGEEVTGRTGAAVAGTHGTGPAPHTAGPHKSDLLNKLDPRVDSDLDHSKTMFGDKTFSQS